MSRYNDFAYHNIAAPSLAVALSYIADKYHYTPCAVAMNPGAAEAEYREIGGVEIISTPLVREGFYLCSLDSLTTDRAESSRVGWGQEGRGVQMEMAL